MITEPTTSRIITGDVLGVVIHGIRLDEFKRARDFPRHRHSTDSIVGYAVRETIRDGKPLYKGTPDAHGNYSQCGDFVAVVDGAGRYSDTFATRDRYRARAGGYAVVDVLYSCGCASC